MPTENSDFFHQEAVKRTLDESEKIYADRVNKDEPIAVSDYDSDFVLRLIRNRIDSLQEAPESQKKVDVENEVQIRSNLRKDIKHLKGMSEQERQEFKETLQDAEGYDKKTGKKREIGVAPGIGSIGINIHTLECRVNTIRGSHDKVIGVLATKIVERNPSFFSDEGADGSYGAESQILYGLIHPNVPGFKSPVVKLTFNAELKAYENRYTSHPKFLTREQISRINNFLINELKLVPVDKLGFLLI
jgi:hypothetical protein